MSNKISSFGSRNLGEGDEDREEEKDPALDRERDDERDLEREDVLVDVDVVVVEEADAWTLEGEKRRDDEEEESSSGRAWRWSGAALASS